MGEVFLKLLNRSITAQAASMVWLCGMAILFIYAVISRVKIHRLVEEAVCTQDNVYLCDAVATPFVLGVIRPRIYLPSGLEKEEMKHVILHEEAHLKRRAVLSCPLAFGEVGVKERVKSVLNYKKPTFRMMCAALIVCVMIAVLFLTNPKKEANIVKTYEQTSAQDSENCVLLTYHEMSDGTWTAGDHIYKYRLEVSGRLKHAAGDTTFIILSNTENITFEQAWKASGLSSNRADYFKPEDSVIVGMIFSEEME